MLAAPAQSSRHVGMACLGRESSTVWRAVPSSCAKELS